MEKDGIQILITSYDLLKRDIHHYEQMSFRFQVIDEAQYIKNAATQSARAVKSVQAQTRFALTGTPIENRLGELWSIFDYLMPGFLFTYARFKKVYESPIVRENDGEAAANLKRLIGPFILRRVKKDVLKEHSEIARKRRFILALKGGRGSFTWPAPRSLRLSWKIRAMKALQEKNSKFWRN